VLLAFQNCPAKRQKSKIDREQLDTKLRHKIPEPPVLEKDTYCHVTISSLLEEEHAFGDM
jgi:hypothetical protein